MGAPILWAPGIFAFFLQENLHVHKIPRFGWFWGLGTPNPPFVLFGAENETLRLKGKMANFEAKNTVKQGKERQKDKWYPFHASRGGSADPIFFMRGFF